VTVQVYVNLHFLSSEESHVVPVLSTWLATDRRLHCLRMHYLRSRSRDPETENASTNPRGGES